MKNYIYLIVISTLFSSCAISQKISYNELTAIIPQLETKNLSIAVWDQRKLVLNGSRKADFVGYLRSGAGIAYPMGTLSGKPFTDEIAINISSSFKRNGLIAFAINTTFNDNESTILNNLKKNSCDKLILIKCNQLHSDGYERKILLYNLQVSIYDKEGTQIERKSFNGEKYLGRGMKYKTYIPIGMKELIEEIFNDPSIKNALNYVPDIQKQNTQNNSANSYDIIRKKDGSEIKSQIVEITVNTVKYKIYEQLDGPIRNILIDDIFMIKYKDGKTEFFQK